MYKKLLFAASSDTQWLSYVNVAAIYPLSKSFSYKRYLYRPLTFGYSSSYRTSQILFF
jgi:hypothetical protein